MEDKKNWLNAEHPFAQFWAVLAKSVEEQTFVKLTLSKLRKQSTAIYKNSYVRLILVKQAVRLSFTYRHPNKDVVKNYSLEESQSVLLELLQQDFSIATLLTTEADWILQWNKKQKARLQRRKPSTRQRPDRSHNRQKQYLVEEDAPFLEHLGLAKGGKILKAHQDKYRQVNKYLEIMAHLLPQIQLTPNTHLVDMGAGKGYLTFALYHYIQQTFGFPIHLLGIELREHLTQFCATQAKALGWSQLQFLAQDILTYDEKAIDILIALHACDIATDIAIAKGIEANAALIVTAPCCHKQVRQAMQAPGSLKSLLKHGILEERQAELLTDSIRALLLEAHGYQAKVFEFISSEHTAKNVMITAVKQANPNQEYQAACMEEVQAIKAQFGIQKHYLEDLLQLAQ